MRKAVLSKPQGQKLRENLSNLINSLTPDQASELFNEFISNTSKNLVMVPCSNFGNCTESLLNSGMVFKMIINEDDQNKASFESDAVTNIKEYVRLYFEQYALEWLFFAINYRDKAVIANKICWNTIIQPILREKIIFHDRSKLNKNNSVQQGGLDGSSSEQSD